MANGNALLLTEDEQVSLAFRLHDEGLFGIAEDPEAFLMLKSARISPHYFNAREGLSDYGTRLGITTAMSVLVQRRAAQKGFPDPSQAYEYLSGAPEAMTSYAASVADSLRMGLLQPRVDTSKRIGNKAPILGRYIAGGRVGMLDDVVTDGKTKIDTFGSMQESGLVIEDYFVVLDREEGGAAQVAEVTGIDITPALGVSAMVSILHHEGRISRTQFDNVRAYMEQYGDPHARTALGLAA